MQDTNYVGILKSVMKDEVTPLLKQTGYTPKGNTFYQHHDGFIKIIDLQKHTGNYSYSATCTINIAIFVPSIDQKSGKPVPKYPKEYECSINYRIGELLAKSKQQKSFSDKWYEYGYRYDAVRRISFITTSELLHDLQYYVLPFLAGFKDKKDTIEFVRKNKQKYFSLMRWQDFQATPVLPQKDQTLVRTGNVCKTPFRSKAVR